jgi:hypothetical protein
MRLEGEADIERILDEWSRKHERVERGSSHVIA